MLVYQLERSSGQWDKGKAFDTFGPIGPYIVTKDEIKDVQNLNLKLKFKTLLEPKRSFLKIRLKTH
jgi:2-keto-4-pentenoate hydratase/2-oxohepta-3-ene-1,7-dioic acid hydratase in catechol pathway